MLSTDPKHLYSEIEAAIRFQEERTKPVGAMVERYVGPYYKDSQTTAYDPVNHAFEFIGLTQAESVFDNPRWKVTTKRGGEHAIIAHAIEQGLNRWTKDVKLDVLLERFYVDQQFWWPIALVERVPMPGSDPGEKTSRRHRPAVKRISPRRFFQDHLSIEREDCRFRGHASIRDKDDVLAEAEAAAPEEGWDVSAVRALATGTGLEKIRSEKRADDPDRKELVLYEVWIPEWHPPIEDEFWDREPEEEWGDYWGGLFLLAAGASQGGERPLAFVRKPRPYYGPPCGPYVQGGEFYVPDEITPLSMFAAIEPLMRELNAQERARLEADRRRKHLIFVNTKNQRLTEAVERAASWSVIPAETENVKANIVDVELGGSTPEQHVTCEYLDNRLRRTSGASDSAVGQPSADVTATAEAIADKGSSARGAMRKRAFSKFVTGIGSIVAFYLFKDDSVVMAGDDAGGTFYGGDPAAHEAELAEGLAAAGVPPEMIPALIQKAHEIHTSASYEDLELDIQPQSMERVSEGRAQQKATILGGMVMQVASVAPTMPHFNAIEFLNDFGRAWDEPELGKYLDPQIMQLMGALNVRQQLSTGMGAAPGQESGGVKPQMKADVRAPAPRPQLAQRAGASGSGAQREGFAGQSSGGKARSVVA